MSLLKEVLLIIELFYAFLSGLRLINAPGRFTLDFLSVSMRPGLLIMASNLTVIIKIVRVIVN